MTRPQTKTATTGARRSLVGEGRTPGLLWSRYCQRYSGARTVWIACVLCAGLVVATSSPAMPAGGAVEVVDHLLVIGGVDHAALVVVRDHHAQPEDGHDPIAVLVQPGDAALLPIDQDDRVADDQAGLLQGPSGGEDARTAGHQVVDHQDGLPRHDPPLDLRMRAVGAHIEQRGIADERVG